MDSSDLQVFRTVAREGTITKAALRLGYVQSNVTARIQRLEAELKADLFIRHNRGMTLSPSGKTLLAYADKIVGLLEEAAKALSATSEPSGPLLIGSTQSSAAVRMPKLLAEYYGKYPNVLLSLTTGHSDFLIEKVLGYELDGAFIGSSIVHPELQTMPAYDEELVVVSAPSIASLEEAVTRPILVFSSGCSYRAVFKQWLPTAGWTHSVVMEFGTLEAIIGGVAAGLGISLLPRSVVQRREAEGAVRAHTVPEAIRHMQATFITRKDSFVSSALQAFIETFTSSLAHAEVS